MIPLCDVQQQYLSLKTELDGAMLDLCIPDEGTCAPCIDGDGDGYGNMGDCRDLDCEWFDGPLEFGLDQGPQSVHP